MITNDVLYVLGGVVLIIYMMSGSRKSYEGLCICSGKGIKKHVLKSSSTNCDECICNEISGV